MNAYSFLLSFKYKKHVCCSLTSTTPDSGTKNITSPSPSGFLILAFHHCSRPPTCELLHIFITFLHCTGCESVKLLPITLLFSSPTARVATILLGSECTTPQKLMSDMAGIHVPASYEKKTRAEQDFLRDRLAVAGQRGWYNDELGKLIRQMARGT